MSTTKDLAEALRLLCKMNREFVAAGVQSYEMGSEVDRKWRLATAALASHDAAQSAGEASANDSGRCRHGMRWENRCDVCDAPRQSAEVVLPEPDEHMQGREISGGMYQCGYTTDQLRAYGDARAAAAILVDKAARGFLLELTREQVSALAVHLAHRHRPAWGWMESPLAAIEQAIDKEHAKIHKEDFAAMDAQFHGITPTAPTQTGAGK